MRPFNSLRTLPLATFAATISAEIDAGALRLETESCSPSMLVQDAFETMLPTPSQRVTRLVHDDDGKDVVVRADPSQLQWVFDNLVDNAVCRTPPGVTVPVFAVESAKEVVFNCDDSGWGIDEAALPHVIERFQRAERSRHDDGGAGLGPATARGIVVTRRGRIQVAPGRDRRSLPFTWPEASG